MRNSRSSEGSFLKFETRGDRRPPGCRAVILLVPQDPWHQVHNGGAAGSARSLPAVSGMIPTPRIQAILTPPAVPPSVLLPASSPQQLREHAAIALTASSHLTCLESDGNTQQRLLTLHPTQPLVAYLLVEDNSLGPKSLILVQHTVTRAIHYQLSLADLAVLVYGEGDPKKIPAAVKSFGALLSLQFLDPSTLFYSGLTTIDDPHAASLPKWSGLALQTSQRVLLLNLRQGPTAILKEKSPKASSFQPILAHLYDAAVGGSPPSSNWLSVTSTWALVGCADGSLKAYDWRSQSVIKSIKGLGKGDWIVKLLAANRYGVRATTPRIITLTKRGIAYLIELQVSDEGIEIRPPLARFLGGEGEALSYDAHRDCVLWHAPRQPKTGPSILVWDLIRLQGDLLQQQVGSKTIFKPDPTTTIGFPENCVSICSSVVDPMWNDETYVSLAVTTHGYVQVFIADPGTSSHAVNSSLTATPVASFSVNQMIDRQFDVDPGLKIQSVACRSLSTPEWVLSTSLGIIVLHPQSDHRTGILSCGSRHCHLGAGLGSVGKSVLSTRHSSVFHTSLDVVNANPSGRIATSKSPFTVLESSAPMHLPEELRRRPFRPTPHFLVSPSGNYVCLLWSGEYRYEVLHLATVLQRVSKRIDLSASSRNPIVASGHAVCDFCWVSDDDTFAVLNAPDAVAILAPSISKEPESQGVGNLKDIRALATKAASTVAKTTKVKAATSKVVKTANKGVKKSLGLFGKGKKKASGDSVDIDNGTEVDDDESQGMSLSAIQAAVAASGLDSVADSASGPSASKHHRSVELRQLVALEPSALDMSASIPAATSNGLGELQIRGGGGSRNPPVALFGGPVLCVCTRNAENADGQAYFYTRKPSDPDNVAPLYTTSGPALPFPDIVAWDDDGKVCAIVTGNRVAVYRSDSPEFCLLGIVLISGPTDPDAAVTSAKFLHGVLFCSTWNSMHCIFLGDIDGGVCHLDSFVLASTDVPAIPQSRSDADPYPFQPPTTSLPLVQPIVIGTQGGSLLVSTISGVYAVPLTHPILRIGILLGAGHLERAVRWLDAEVEDAESVAAFMERRGYPELGIQVPGLSLETMIDWSMRFGFVDRLEELVDDYGVEAIRMVDMGRGMGSSTSLVVCVGAYLLAHGKVELTRQIATECLRLEDGRKDAFALATILLSVDEADAMRLVKRAVDLDGTMPRDWILGDFAREYLRSDETI